MAELIIASGCLVYINKRKGIMEDFHILDSSTFYSLINGFFCYKSCNKISVHVNSRGDKLLHIIVLMFSLTMGRTVATRLYIYIFNELFLRIRVVEDKICILKFIILFF